MPPHSIETTYCDVCFRNLLDGEDQHPFARSVYLPIDDGAILQIHEGRMGLDHLLSTLGPIPDDLLYPPINIKRTYYFFDF